MPPWDVILDILLTTILPCIVVSFVAGWFLRKTSYTALAVLFGAVAGNAGSRLLPWWPSEQEMSLLLLMVGLSFLLIDVRPKQWWVGVIFVVSFSSYLIQAEIRALMQGESFLEMVYYSVYCLVAVSLYLALTRAERLVSGRVMLLLYSLWGLAASIILIYAHSGLLSQIALLWMCSCIGLLCAYSKRTDAVRGLAAPATILLQYLLSYGLQTCYCQVPAVAFVLAGVAPLACLVMKVNESSPRLRRIAIVGWLMLLLIACSLAIYCDNVLFLD